MGGDPHCRGESYISYLPPDQKSLMALYKTFSVRTTASSTHLAVDVGEQGHDLLLLLVHIRQPGLGRPRIVRAVDPPVSLDPQVILIDACMNHRRSRVRRTAKEAKTCINEDGGNPRPEARNGLRIGLNATG